MTVLFRDVQASLFYFLKQLVAEHNGELPSFQTYKFDAHAQENELPLQDLIGVSDLSLTDEGGLLTITTQFVICTINDVGLMRLDKMTDYVYEKVAPDNTLDLIRHTDGVKIGNLKTVPGVTIFPVARADNRPIKGIGVELKSDLASNRE